MIKFSEVSGPVLVSDVERGYNQMAEDKLELDEHGNYLIATTTGSSAKVSINGKSVALGSSSFLRVRGNRSWLDRHAEMWTSDMRVFLGKLWKRVAGDPRDPGGANATIGVRG